ncbi:RHS repeat-associated core domain-containing protein [Brevibacillus fortis]|uniref:RHS repeat-associated core domain-containing protein n=1 Tax=Brevibacillus fortis TaxID=2126352 RepID=UPI0038FC0880
MNLQKWLTSFVTAALVTTAIFPSMVYGAPTDKSAKKDTKEWVIEKINSVPSKSAQETDAAQVPVLTQEEMKAISWDPLSVDKVIEMNKKLDRKSMQIASYFYPKLRKLLSNKEKVEQNTWNDKVVQDLLKNVTNSQREQLVTHVPDIFTFEKTQTEEVAELSKQSMAIALAAEDVQYSVGQMAQYYTKTYSGKPVDAFYRAANLVETDLALSGKNGMDLVIQRAYNQLDSKTREPILKYDSRNDTWENRRETKLFKNEFIPFATGWSFNFPTFEYYDEITTEEVSHFSESGERKTQYKLAVREDEAGRSVSRYVFHLEDGTTLIREGNEWVNYPYEGISFTEQTVGRDVELIVNGYRYTFDRSSSELLVTKRNPFGDTIRYRMDEQNDHVVEIEDTYGRYVVMERDKAGGIKNLKLYRDQTDKDQDEPIKTIDYDVVYSNDTSPERSTSAELLSVEQNAEVIASYAYEMREAEFNLISDYTFNRDDSFAFESDDYLNQDNENRSKNLDYLLLRSVHYPINGLAMTYYYSIYQENKVAQSRGVVRLYQDDNILSYVSYHPVSMVDFSYIPYGKTEEEVMYSMEYSMVNGAGQKTWEIWKKPRTWSAHRLIDADERFGDIVSTIEYDSYSHGVEQTFYTDDSGNHLLKRVRTKTLRDNPDLQISDGNTTYKYNPVQYTTYAYQDKKPLYQFSFMDGVPNEAVREFLMDPQVNPDGSLQIDSTSEEILPNYANITKFRYNDFGDITEHVDASGIVTKWNYELFTVWGEAEVYRPVEKVTKKSADNALAQTNSFTFNADMLIDQETEERTYSTSTGERTDTVIRNLEYNTEEQVSKIEEITSTTDPAIADSYLVTTFDQYDNYGHVIEKGIKEVDLGNQTTDLVFHYEYVNGLDLLETQTFSDGSTVHYFYDNLDRLNEEVFDHDEQKKTVAYTFDDASRSVTKEVFTNGEADPNGLKQVTYYTVHGDVEFQEEVSNNGTRTLVANEYSRSLFDGRHVRSTTPNGMEERKLEYDYYSDGSLKSVTNSQGEATTHSYANTAVTDDSYLPQGAAVAQHPNGLQTVQLLDPFGYVQVEQAKDLSQTRRIEYDYDGWGRLSTKEVYGYDGEIRYWNYLYDVAGNLVSLIDPLNQEYRYDYNPQGNLVKVTENGTETRRYAYNNLSWKLGESDVQGNQSESIRYQLNGEIDSVTDKAGNVHQYSYTPFYEIAELRVSKTDGTTVYTSTNEYDPITRKITRQSNSDGQEIAYSYDAFGRLKNQTAFNRNYTIGYENDDNAMDYLTYPDGTRVNYSYDYEGRIKSVDSTLSGLITYQYTRSTTGDTETVRYPNGTEARKEYNSFGEAVTTGHTQNGSSVWSEQLQYDAFGNKTEIQQNGKTYRYAYDQIDRIETESNPQGERTYRYDTRGNREHVEGTEPHTKDSYTFTYDGFNRLKNYSKQNGDSGSFSYNPDGLRAVKESNRDTTKYVYVNGYVIEELDQNGNVKAQNIWGNGILFRKLHSGGQQGGYYLGDSLGNVKKIVDKNGQVLNTYEYDIWGNIVSKSESMANPFTYTSEIYDAETGLYYLRARYYDPSVGRFISEDAYKGQVENPLSLNRYTYVHNNPLRFVDPSGNKIKGLDFSWSGFLLRYDNNVSVANLLEARWENEISKEAFLGNVGIEFDDWEDILYENQQRWGSFKLDSGAKPDMKERTAAAYLMMMGKDVLALDTKNNQGLQGAKSPDFLVDGVLTELKTLTGDNLNHNTASGQMSSGLRQGASIVIIDTMKYEGVNEFDVFDIVYHGFKTYHSNYRDILLKDNTEIQIWTKEGIYNYNIGSNPYGRSYD